MKKSKLKTEQISTRLLYALIGVAVVVFALFYLVGYDTPYIFDPDYKAPLFTGLLLVFIYLLVAVAVGVAAVSVWHGLKQRDKGELTVNGIPAGKIAVGTAALLVLSLVLTFALGGSSPITVNGKVFADGFWLRLTDMFINTTIVLVIVAAAAVGYSMSGANRRMKKHKL